MSQPDDIKIHYAKAGRYRRKGTLRIMLVDGYAMCMPQVWVGIKATMADVTCMRCLKFLEQWEVVS